MEIEGQREEKGGSVTAADYFQPFRIHYRGSILLCLKSTTGQCIIRKWSHGPAIVSKLLCYPRFFRPSFFIPLVDSLPPIPLPRKRRNAGASVGVLQLLSPFLSSHGDSHRLINQTSVNKSLRRSHGGSRRSSYSSFSPSSSAFTSPALLARLFYTTSTDVHPRGHAFLPSSCILIGITRRSRKETAVLLSFLNPKLVWSTRDIPSNEKR